MVTRGDPQHLAATVAGVREATGVATVANALLKVPTWLIAHAAAFAAAFAAALGTREVEVKVSCTT